MSSATRLWVRRLSGAALVVGLAAVAAVATYRARQRQPTTVGRSPHQVVESDDASNGEAVSAFEGLELHEIVAGERIFSLNANQTLGFASGWQEIEDVRLQLYREGEPGPVLTCQSASFNVQSRDARLKGTVHLQLADGGFVSTQTGHFDADARRFTTDAPAVFASSGTVGQAGRVVYSLMDNRLTLTENAVIYSEQGAQLRAPRIDYIRDRLKVVFPEGCRIEYQQSVITAAQAEIELEEREGAPTKIALRDGVTVSSPRTERTGTLAGWARQLVATREDAGRWEFRATTNGPWVTFTLLAGQGFFERTLQTWELRGVAGPEGIENLVAEQAVCLFEVPATGGTRQGEARRARVWFTDGDATDVELEREVVLTSEGLRASGTRARVSTASGLVVLHADPSGRERAELLSDQGRVTSDQVQLYEEDGRAEALGNVQGQLQDLVLPGMELEPDRAPLHFAAEALTVTENGDTFDLKRGARAWQGRRLLLADELLYHHSAASLQASGHVRTTFPASQLDPEVESSEDVVVVSRSLDYSRVERRALYKGSVTYSDSSHILSASELLVEFDERSVIQAVEATGAVELTDLATGRRMVGQKARREMASQIVNLSGAPVQLTDPRGNTLSGTSLTWDQASGRVSVFGGPDSPTETIYHPEEPPVLPTPASARSNAQAGARP